MNKVTLTKQSTESDLKRYFTAVLELSKEDNKFPVNLDEVWPLVYAEKGKAVRALRKDFFENEDFKVFAQNGEKSNGRPVDNYFLSLSCLEYFIARKVRPVFEVYRQVFHKVAEINIPSYQIEDRIKRAEAWIEEEKVRQRLALENEELSEDLINANKRIDYQRNEIKSRKEAMKEQHQQILDLETKNTVLDRRNLKLENEALANAGKVNYYDRCQKEADKTLKGLRKTANLLGIKEEIFINTLLYNGYLYRDRYGKLRAYAKYLNKFFMLKECEENEYGFTPTQTCTTIIGRKFIIENWSRLYKKYQDYINSIK